MALTDEEEFEPEATVYNISFHPSLQKEDITIEASSMLTVENGSFVAFYNDEGEPFLHVNSSFIFSIEILNEDDLDEDEEDTPSEERQPADLRVVKVEAAKTG